MPGVDTAEGFGEDQAERDGADAVGKADPQDVEHGVSLDFSGFQKLEVVLQRMHLAEADFKLLPRMCALAEELAARPDNHLLLGHIDGDEGVVFISDDGGHQRSPCCLK